MTTTATVAASPTTNGWKKAFSIRTVLIGDGERGLLFRNRRLERVLMPGVVRLWSLRDRLEVRVCDLAAVEYGGKDVETLIATLGPALAEHFLLVDIGVDEVGLLSVNGKLVEVLAPGSRRLFWKGGVEVSYQTLDLRDTLEMPAEVLKRLRQLGKLAAVATVVDVPMEAVGLVFVDGKLARQLGPGAYAWWAFRKDVVADVVDLRTQALEVAGQELLTRDRLSLRVNLSGSWRIVDPLLARTRVAKIGEFLYRELQYGLRKVVAARTLDELLGDKASLDADILSAVRAASVGYGIEVLGVGVKDVILPGDLKDILNGVVQAEKQAQANVIRRREEANATRSLLNTAKLIDESPTLMRLKELETLEKVTEKIDKLTVFGGLDGVVNQLVSLKAG